MTEKQPPLHILYALAMTYLSGANLQLARYETVAANLKEQPAKAVQECLHEVSCLFEDLATVSRYCEMGGQKHELHGLWFDVRNHIRHDVREEFDNESDKRKNERAKRLGLHEGLQFGISFKDDSITVGEQVIDCVTIREYIKWADDIITTVMQDAKNKGWITGDSIQAIEG